MVLTMSADNVGHFTSVVNEVKHLRKSTHVYWKEPSIMGASFLGGLAFMAAHHALYVVVEGDLAVDADLQSWVIRGGTALAFLSKVLLAIATGVAYDQWLWLDLHAKSHEMASLDSMFAVLTNAFEFSALRLWVRRPALTFLAAVTWLLPISAVLTPGTLSVQPIERRQNESLIIPQRAYTTTANLYCGVTSDGESTAYTSMATGLLNPTFATVLANDILPMQSTPSNLTYDLQFHGPAVTCMESGDDDFRLARDAIAQFEDLTETRVFYYGWVPQPGWGPGFNGSFFASTDVQIGNVRLDVQSEDAARVFVYLNTTGADADGTRIPFQETPSAQMMTCMLYNASYATYFDIQSTGEKRITTNKEFQNWMPALSAVEGPSSDPAVRIQMNMQAVMEAFGMMLIGPIVYANDATSPTINSVYALGMNAAMYPSREGLSQSQMTRRMITQSEALFQNITLSMRYGVVAGNAGPDETTASAVSSFLEPQFVYQPRTLLIAYGLSTFFALTCVLMGVHALLQNGASYTNTFSTIVRVTRDPMLSRLVEGEGDLQGAQPVPRHIGRAEVRLGRGAKSSPTSSSNWA